MTAKQYLRQAFYLNQRINDSLHDLEELRTKAETIKATAPSADKIYSRKSSDAVGDAVAKIVDLENKINIKIDELTEKKHEIEEFISKIYEENIKIVLLKRYIHFQEYSEIAGDLGYSIQRIYQLHKAGLDEIQKIRVN